MNTLTLSTQNNSYTTTISNTFIDTFMPMANGEFIKIYIYLLRCVSDRQANVSISSLADVFNQTEADVMRALRYWDKAGAVNLIFDQSGSRLAGITFCDLNSAQYNAEPVSDYTAVTQPAANMQAATSVQTATNMQTSASVQAAANMQTSASVQAAATAEPILADSNNAPAARATDAAGKTSSAYTPSQIKALKEQDDFSMLLYALGAYLGGTLNSGETSTIAYLYDTLHFSAELIEYLVDYCISKGKKSMRYIEKVALNWADEGIHTIKEAKAASASHNEVIYSVLNAFGITNRDAGQLERDYITKWTDIYCFNTDIIIEACNRTLRATHQPSFEYADSILTKWQSANVKTTDDIKKIDAEYEQNRQNLYTKRTAQAPKTSNKFNNFQQRNTDIDSLESTLISNNG